MRCTTLTYKDGGTPMLEANTDRSYFMIGAVIAAAVIIAGVLYIFRDVLFGNAANPGLIPDLINDVFTKASTMINGINQNTAP